MNFFSLLVQNVLLFPFNFQEEVSRLNKRIEQMMVEHNNVVLERNGLQQQCTQAVRKWDITLRERERLEDDLKKVVSYNFHLFFQFSYQTMINNSNATRTVTAATATRRCNERCYHSSKKSHSTDSGT